MNETLPQFLDALAAVGPDGEALAYAPDDTVVARMSWAELVAESRLAARKLVGLGAQKGTRVGLLCTNRREWLPLAFGVLRTGAILVPLSTLWTRDELAYALGHADVEVLLTLSAFRKHRYLDMLRDIAPETVGASPAFAPALPALRRVVALDSEAAPCPSWDSVDAGVDEDFLDALGATVAPTDLATIFFTSGTTAQAKAVVHTNAALALSARRLAPCFGMTPEDAWWGHMPLFWSGGFILGALATLAGRGRIVLQESVSPDAALRLLERERCTVMAGWHQAGPLLEHPAFDRERIFLRKGTYHALAQRLMGPDHQTIGVYGMSETATCVTASRSDDSEELRVGSFGRPLAGMRLRIVDPETGAEVAPGSVGEITVSGPTLMEGYYRVPRSETFDPSGYFHTGDLGCFDERGALHFASRLKDVIKTAGVNVAAVEVEQVLARHPAVAQAHVVGVPHPVRGENVAACVVLADGGTSTEDALRNFCRESLAAYKVPRHVIFLRDSELPRTGSGKVIKGTLRRLAAERVEAAGLQDEARA